MRHKGSVSQINLDREKIIPALYRKAKAVASWPTNVMKLCEIAAGLPVTKFYISFDSALYYVRSRFYYKKNKKFTDPFRQKLYDAFYDRFLELKESPAHKEKKIPDVVLLALLSPAPTCGLSPLRIYYILLKNKKIKK